MRPTTEVILCTYNGAAFIAEQLESILGQTTPVDRISIFDDASTDDTLGTVRATLDRRSAETAIRVEVHAREENLGHRANFADAIAHATHDVLFLCDQDDVWEPTKVEALLALLSAEGADMVFSDGSVVDAQGRPLGRGSVLRSYGLAPASLARFRHRAFDLLLKRNYINGASCAVRRTVAQNALPLPPEIPHDYWLAIWCALHGGIAVTPQPLYRYRQHAANAVGLGSANPLYAWLGIWRQPRRPREREARIWRGVCDRIQGLGCDPRGHAAARRKVEWLSRVVAGGRTDSSRGYEIAKSALDGSYQHYSTADALLRDIVSLIRS